MDLGRNEEFQALMRKPEKDLTPEEKLRRFGPGSPNVCKYAVREENGQRILVCREFQPGEPIPPEWKDSPADFGHITHPPRAKAGELPENTLAVLPPAPSKSKAA